MQEQIVRNYAQILYDLNISQVSLSCMHQSFLECPVLMKVLESPVVHENVKRSIIAKVFPPELHAFLCVLCHHQHASLLPQIYDCYTEYTKIKQGVLTAQYISLTLPSNEQLDEIKEFLKQKYHVKEIEVQPVCDPNMLGGYILHVGNAEYDHSYRGLLQQFKKI